ncbi:MAG: DNA repair exonuclease [Asgard group archaeon]|nr:DNA repair exonuclease [Asgard group archaeon]
MSERKTYTFCHTADWHLDYYQYQKRERWQDFFKAANNCVKKMIKDKPDFIIHSGDLFHNFKPSPGALRLTLQILEKVKKAKIPFYIIRGNHDASKAQVQRYGGTVLLLLEELGYLQYIQDDLITHNDDIAIMGIGEYGKLTNNVLKETLRNNPLDDNKFNILALHGYIQGQISDTQYDISPFELNELNFDYVALGHYHKKWEDKENHLFCPGSTEQTSLNDWDIPVNSNNKFMSNAGYYKITIKKSEKKEWAIDYRWQTFKIRPKGRFSITFNDKQTVDEIIKQANSFIKAKDKTDAIICYDFKGKIVDRKIALLNFSSLKALEDTKALHYMVNQKLSPKKEVISVQKISLTETISTLLKETYEFEEKTIPHWLNLIDETIKNVGGKTISSYKAEEIEILYKYLSSIISDLLLKNNDLSYPKKKADKKQPKKESESSSPQKTIERAKSRQVKRQKQANLADYFQEEEK